MDYFEFFKAVLVGGFATSMATQILKWDIIPIPFEKYPRLTAVVASFIAAGVSVYQADSTILSTKGLMDWISVAVGTIIVAIYTYNKLIKSQPGSKTDL